jgi:hypothetical protein
MRECFSVAAGVKSLSAYVFLFLCWGRCPRVQSCLATVVDTQFRAPMLALQD